MLVAWILQCQMLKGKQTVANKKYFLALENQNKKVFELETLSSLVRVCPYKKNIRNILVSYIIFLRRYLRSAFKLSSIRYG